MLHKKLGLDVLKYLNFPIMFSCTGNLPPATPLNYVPYVLVCFVFNNIIRRRRFGWWSKYNCEYLLLRFVKTPMIFLFLTWVWARYSVCWFGRGLWHRPHNRLLCSAIPQVRHNRPELCSDVVGKHCLSKNSRLYGRAIQDDRRRRNVWSVQLVKLLKSGIFCEVMLCRRLVRDGWQWCGDIELHCELSIKFSAVFSGSVLRITYVCVNTSHWLLFIFLSFPRG